MAGSILCFAPGINTLLARVSYTDRARPGSSNLGDISYVALASRPRRSEAEAEDTVRCERVGVPGAGGLSGYV